MSRAIYDSGGRPVATINQLAYRTTQVYDSAGRRTKLINANNATVTFLFDAAGQDVGGIDPLGARVTYGYNAVGSQSLKIDPAGNRTTNSYDGNASLTEVQFSDGRRHTFGYDASGNRTLMVDSTGRTTTVYDGKSRVTAVVNPGPRPVTYGYDAIDRRTVMIEPEGGRFSTSYDSNNRLTVIVNPQTKRTSQAYDAADRLIGQQMGNGSRVTNAYDDASQVTAIINAKGDGTAINRFTYTFDNVGNRLTKAELNGVRTTWTYDDSSQLVREQRNDASALDVTHIYDPVGNRTVHIESGVRTTASYDAANQLLTENAAGSLTTYTNDACGNRTKKESASTTTHYNWDACRNLVEVEPPTGKVTMTYNAAGKRVKKETTSETTKFLYDFERLLQETDDADTVQNTYTSTLEQYGDLLSQYDGTDASYHQYDGLGSTDALINEAEMATDRYTYRAFGLENHTSGNSDNKMTFVGKKNYYRDSESDLYLLKARYYDPVAARFLSEDPLGFEAGDVNLYRYTANNPVNIIDPSGLQFDFGFEPIRAGTQGGGFSLANLPRPSLPPFFQASIPTPPISLPSIDFPLPGGIPSIRSVLGLADNSLPFSPNLRRLRIPNPLEVVCGLSPTQLIRQLRKAWMRIARLIRRGVARGANPQASQPLTWAEEYLKRNPNPGLIQGAASMASTLAPPLISSLFDRLPIPTRIPNWIVQRVTATGPSPTLLLLPTVMDVGTPAPNPGSTLIGVVRSVLSNLIGSASGSGIQMPPDLPSLFPAGLDDPKAPVRIDWLLRSVPSVRDLVRIATDIWIGIMPQMVRAVLNPLPLIAIAIGLAKALEIIITIVIIVYVAHTLACVIEYLYCVARANQAADSCARTRCPGGSPFAFATCRNEHQPRFMAQCNLAGVNCGAFWQHGAAAQQVFTCQDCYLCECRLGFARANAPAGRVHQWILAREGGGVAGAPDFLWGLACAMAGFANIPPPRRRQRGPVFAVGLGCERNAVRFTLAAGFNLTRPIFNMPGGNDAEGIFRLAADLAFLALGVVFRIQILPVVPRVHSEQVILNYFNATGFPVAIAASKCICAFPRANRPEVIPCQTRLQQARVELASPVETVPLVRTQSTCLPIPFNGVALALPVTWAVGRRICAGLQPGLGLP